MMDRVDELGAREQEALAALWKWLDEHPVEGDAGAMVWSSGMPVALDVLRVLDQIASRTREA